MILRKIETRTNLEANGSGLFSEGDQIGLYIKDDSEIRYQELTFKNGEWLPRLKRKDFGTDRLILSAHYPIMPKISSHTPENQEFSVAQDQNGPGKEMSDLLFAQTVIEKDNYQAKLYFHHIMHRLKIDLSGDTNNANVAVRSRLGGVVNLLTGNSLLSDNEFQWINPAKNSDGSFEVIIYPQTVSAYCNDNGALLRVSANGKEHYFNPPL